MAQARFAGALGGAFACAVTLGAALLAGEEPALAHTGATPAFAAPDCPAQLRAGATLTGSLLADATHTVKRYSAGSDTRGGEVGCNYYDPATNYNYSWTVYYLFKTDSPAVAAQAVQDGFGPLGGWAHPSSLECGVSKTAYAYVDCSPSSDAATKAGALAMLSATEPMAAPQATAATTTSTAPAPVTSKGQPRLTPGDLRRNKQYRTFFGLDDPRISDENLQIRSTFQCNSLVSRAVHFSQVTNTVEIPNETSSGQHSASIFSDSDFHDLLDSSLPPSSLKDNVFVEATRDYEQELRAAVVTSSGKLQPADVLALALGVTHGSYPLAVLTTLNLLKDVTFDGREAATLASRLVSAHPRTDAAIAKEHELFDRQIAILEQQNAVVGKLVSLRANPLTAHDKMGPWYHAFTILTVGALYDAPIPKGLATAFWEHFRKAIRAFGDSEAPFNLEKATLDFCFAVATDSASLHGLAR